MTQLDALIGSTKLAVALFIVTLCFPSAKSAVAAEQSDFPVMTMPTPLEPDETGFVSIFDGKTLNQWDGDPALWRVENGSVVGETKPQTHLKDSTFLIWRGGSTRNFELKLEYRISPGGNSGVYYRSDESPKSPWILSGYQADIDGPEWSRSVISPFISPGIFQWVHLLRVSGQNYDEDNKGAGRQFLALPGQFTYVGNGKIPKVVGYLDTGPRVDEIATNDWNELHIVARDDLLIHILNGHVMSIVIDDDTKNRHLNGKLGLQLHPGDPMRVEFRRIRIKTL